MRIVPLYFLSPARRSGMVIHAFFFVNYAGEPRQRMFMDAVRPERDSQQRGFTLIEVLVVAAIIALLLAILLPSLGRVRERSRAAVCLSQLKELGHAMQLYS